MIFREQKMARMVDECSNRTPRITDPFSILQVKGRSFSTSYSGSHSLSEQTYQFPVIFIHESTVIPEFVPFLFISNVLLA